MSAKPISFLVVEDEADGREVMSELLNYFDIAADTVATAEEALDLFSQNRYDGVLIDLHLPGMDGWGLLQEIRAAEQGGHTPCIAVTAYHTSLVRSKALEAGFDAYYPKPINDANFVEEITAIISKN